MPKNLRKGFDKGYEATKTVVGEGLKTATDIAYDKVVGDRVSVIDGIATGVNAAADAGVEIAKGNFRGAADAVYKRGADYLESEVRRRADKYAGKVIKKLPGPARKLAEYAYEQAADTAIGLARD